MGYRDDKLYATATEEPAPGVYLYASCSAEEYGRIVAVGEDSNGNPTIDIEVLHPNDLIDCEDEEGGEWEHALTWLEVPAGVTLILRDVQYRIDPSKSPEYPAVIICNTPGNSCFRCTKMFTMYTDTLDERCRRDMEVDGFA